MSIKFLFILEMTGSTTALLQSKAACYCYVINDQLLTCKANPQPLGTSPDPKA